jgi:hypothetical protein
VEHDRRDLRRRVAHQAGRRLRGRQRREERARVRSTSRARPVLALDALQARAEGLRAELGDQRSDRAGRAHRGHHLGRLPDATGPRPCARSSFTRPSGRRRCRPTCAARAASAPGRARAALRLRRPEPERALAERDDALTLVAQSSIRPSPKGKMSGERHPLLRAALAARRARGARRDAGALRVTLSYFVEPNPGRRGWKKRHRYASHGLRFDVKGPTESLEEFRKRLNKKALDEDEEARDRRRLVGVVPRRAGPQPRLAPLGHPLRASPPTSPSAASSPSTR